jgi:hypothetical protein
LSVKSSGMKGLGAGRCKAASISGSFHICHQFQFQFQFQFDSIRFDSIQFDSIRFNSIRFDSIRFDSIRLNPVHIMKYKQQIKFC